MMIDWLALLAALLTTILAFLLLDNLRSPVPVSKNVYFIGCFLAPAGFYLLFSNQLTGVKALGFEFAIQQAAGKGITTVT
jgi:hypothetical protein